MSLLNNPKKRKMNIIISIANTEKYLQLQSKIDKILPIVKCYCIYLKIIKSKNNFYQLNKNIILNKSYFLIK